MNKGKKGFKFSRGEKGLLVITLAVLFFLLAPFIYNPIYTAVLNHTIRSNNTIGVGMLLALPGDINRYNSLRMIEDAGNTPLEEACIQGNVAIVKMLIGKDVDVNANMGSWGPLMVTLTSKKGNQYEIAKLLIENGVEIKEDRDSLILALLREEYSEGGMAGPVKKDYISAEEMYDLFILLIDNGANLYEGGGTGYRTSLPNRIMYGAALQGNYQIFDYLLTEEGFDVNENLGDGNTALIVAAKYDNQELVEYLLSKGADETMENDERQTALDIARENGNQEIMGLLE